MGGYLHGFLFYTLAIVGVLLLATVICKKVLNFNTFKTSDKKELEVQECLSIGVKKDLMIVKVNNEKFLIASDAERTTFLTKLENEKTEEIGQTEERPRAVYREETSNSNSVLVSMLKKMNR